MKETFYIDSNVFLYPVLYGDLKESERAREILSQIERKDIQAYTSTLTWDEVSYVIERTLGKTDAIEIGKKFLNFPFLRFIAVDDEVIRRSQALREKYNLKPRDSIHLSCAIERNIFKIITDDADFDEIKEIQRIPIRR
ncbi:MAG: type II toxin-antitoxin system VapC family toxin [Thermoplasmataceae archaeon]|jgi:predicted nucleic acid-binding protein|nr:MAG: type II toxin-antitoxin system VapC family toxin [Cuniculiplasma divulgatum]